MSKLLVEVHSEVKESQKLEANIFYDSVTGYSVEYYIAENHVKSIAYPNKSKFFVENEIRSWFKGIEMLNG